MFQHARIRNLTTAANTVGAVLPTDFSRLVDHARTIGEQVRSNGKTEPVVVAELCQHLGDAESLSAALPGALDALVRSSAAGSLAAHLETKTAGAAWRAARTHVVEIAAAFGAALQPAIDTLNENASVVPAWTSADTIEDLSPAQFEAWKACQSAEATLEVALRALAPLYGQQADVQFTADGLRRATVCALPDALDYELAWSWTRAVCGQRQLGGPLGAMRIDYDGSWFASVAALGSGFAWASPSDTAARIARVKSATVKPLLVRQSA